MHKKLIMKKCKILILILTMILLAGCGKHEVEIDITEFVSAKFTGLNGKAEAYVKFDFPSFEEAIISKVDSEDISVTQLAVLEESIKLETDKTEGITNGDTINVSVSFNEELAANIGVKLIGTEITFEAVDLEEGKEINPFNDIILEYSGVAPYAKVSVNNDASDLANVIRYNIENTDNIMNGDEIKVTVSYNAEELDAWGYIITETEQTFIAEGIDYYITECADIDEETFKRMESRAIDWIESELAYNSYQYRKIMYPKDFIGLSLDKGEVSNIELTSAYLLVLKELGKDSFSAANYIYLIFKVTTIDEKNPEGKTTYVPVGFKNLIMQSEGIDVDTIEPYITSDTYEIIDDMLRELITDKSDKYTYEELTY